jgi:alpha-maltose-1-phosphate synthase
MQVVHLLRKYNPAEWGGTESAVKLLCHGLRRHRVDSVVYSPRTTGLGTNDPLAESGCRVRRFRACVPVWGLSPEHRRQMVAVGGNLMSFDLPVALARERDAALIHTHTLGRLGGIARTVARWRRVPLVVTIHGGVLDLPSAVREQLRRPARGGWEWGRVCGLLLRSRRLLSEADAVLTCNPREAALLREQYPDQEIRVQPHGVPAEQFQVDHRPQAGSAFPQLSGKPVLLCVGRIDPVKNQRWLVDQMPALLRRHPEAVLVLAGACTDAAYGQALERQVAGDGLNDRVCVTGGLPPGDPRLIGLFQAARAVMVPSISETFGLVILEAWAAGTPVIASRTSGALALVQPGANGWLFHLARPEEFHHAVDQLFANPRHAAQFAATGRQWVRAEFDATVLAGRMKQLYERLIEQKHAPGHLARRRYECLDPR